MGFINKKIQGVNRKDGNKVHVRRGYYTFSKYYPAGDSNHVYRKSISRAKREKRTKTTLIVLGVLAVAVLVTLLILL